MRTEIERGRENENEEFEIKFKDKNQKQADAQNADETGRETQETGIECGQHNESSETVIKMTSEPSQIGETNPENSCESDLLLIRFVDKFKMTAVEYVITISVFALAVMLSVSLKGEGGIKFVMEIVGDVGCSGMAFLLPPIIFLRIFKKKEYSMFFLISVILVFILGMGIWIQMVAKWITNRAN